MKYLSKHKCNVLSCVCLRVNVIFYRMSHEQTGRQKEKRTDILKTGQQTNGYAFERSDRLTSRQTKEQTDK